MAENNPRGGPKDRKVSHKNVGFSNLQIFLVVKFDDS